MSEKIELIDAKDLPVTEEEDVTVLCVGADGEMVRRDAGSFGMKASDLAELPTTEAEEVDVICVDAEGNLCRKSSKSFGGGRYILKPTVDEILLEDGDVIITTDCTDMVKAIDAGASASILLPAGSFLEGSPLMLQSFADFMAPNDELVAATIGATYFFPNAPIPSFLQE